ncbi:MAG: fibronectin type III domain-containing protein [Chitinophagia bacterium]|nr:fibronectin type III domain-containing protein [Chitinophagia bacterium]
MKQTYISILFSLLFFGCLKLDLPRDNPRDGKVAPSVTTNMVSNITGISATGNGEVTNDGGTTVTERGIVYSTSSQSTIATGNVAKATSGGVGQFSVSITGLLPNTRYYYAAYATNLIGTTYGTFNSFTTPASGATLTTTAPSQITSNSAASGGTINSDGGSTITAKGVCWSLTTTPTISLSTKTMDGSGVGSYPSILNNLKPNTMYYVRAYATNSTGTNYGNEFSFTTLANVPTFSSLAPSPSNLTSDALSVTYQITDEGGAPVTQKGVCWSTTTTPTIADSKTSDGPTNGVTTHTSSVTGLKPGTLYYLRAYATNSAGTSYSAQINFTTRTVPATLTTTIASNITRNSAVSGGNITNDGGSTITARGVCWSQTTDPTINNFKIQDVTGGTGTFTSQISGLNPNTTYNVRAYATNSLGTTVYGNQISFQTTNTSIPTVSTGSVVVSAFSVTLSNNNVTDNGNDPLTERGIVWNTISNVSNLNNKIVDPLKTMGTYSGTITGLLPGTTYFGRAYATNSLGTGYGNEITFTTSISLPVVSTTTAVSNILVTSASSGGTISSDGGSPITVKGICWSTTSSPTISASKTNNGSGTGSFTSEMTALTTKTKYFVRAYATNAAGTAYGPEISFTTQ